MKSGDVNNKKKGQLELKLSKKYFEIFDIIIFLLPVLSFGYALYVYFPGCLTFDSYNQLTQIATLEFTSGHPFFHTLIEMILLKVWNNPAIIGIFQILCFSIIWTFICKYNRKHTKNVKLKIMQVLLTLFICINAFNSIHAITLWKDILYSYMILLLSFVFQISIDKKFIFNNKEIFWISLLIAVIPNLRHNGLIIFVISVSILAFMLFLKDRASKNWLKMILCSFLCFFIIQLPGNIVTKDDGALSGYFYQKVLHITGDYLHKDLFYNDEKEFLISFINIDSLFDLYNPYFLDPMAKVDMDRYAYKENERRLIKLLIEKSLKNPRSFTKYLGDSTVIIWKVKLPINMIGTVLTIGYDAENNVDDIQQIHTNESFFLEYNNYISNIFGNKYLKTILFSPAFYLYISTIFTVAIVIIKKWQFSYFLILVPNISNIIGLVIAIPIQDGRYVYGSFLVGYLTMIILMGSIFQKEKQKTKRLHCLDV